MSKTTASDYVRYVSVTAIFEGMKITDNHHSARVLDSTDGDQDLSVQCYLNFIATNLVPKQVPRSDKIMG